MSGFFSAIGSSLLILGAFILPLWLVLWIYQWIQGGGKEDETTHEDASTRTYAWLVIGAFVLIAMMSLRNWLR